MNIEKGLLSVLTWKGVPLALYVFAEPEDSGWTEILEHACSHLSCHVQHLCCVLCPGHAVWLSVPKYREQETSGILDCPKWLGLLLALAPTALQLEQLYPPSCTKRGLAAKAHLPFLCAAFEVTGSAC